MQKYFNEIQENAKSFQTNNMFANLEISTNGHYAFQGFCNVGLWKLAIMQLANLEILKSWNLGILETCNLGILVSWNLGILKL